MEYSIAFKEKVARLFAQLKLVLIEPESKSFYSLKINQLEFELVEAPEGFVTFLCFPGNTAIHTEFIAFLLVLNRYQAAHPPIHASLLQHENLVAFLWSRLSLQQATDELLADLLVRMVKVGQAIRDWQPAGVSDSLNQNPRCFI